MNYQQLAERFRGLESPDIATTTATLEITTFTASLLSAISERTRFRTRSPENPQFRTLEEQIASRANSLSSLSPAAGQRALLAVVSEIANVKYPLSSTPDPDFMKSTIRSLSEGFQRKGDRTPIESVDDFSRIVLDDLTDVLRMTFDRMSPDQINDAALALRDWYNSAGTPENQREEFRSLLDLNDITTDAIRAALPKLVATTGGYALFYTGGFGPYLAITTITHALFTSTLGITLPFGAYTTLTSLTAALFNPLVLVMIALGSLGSAFGRTARNARKRLAAYALFQLLIAR